MGATPTFQSWPQNPRNPNPESHSSQLLAHAESSGLRSTDLPSARPGAVLVPAALGLLRLCSQARPARASKHCRKACRSFQNHQLESQESPSTNLMQSVWARMRVASSSGGGGGVLARTCTRQGQKSYCSRCEQNTFTVGTARPSTCPYLYGCGSFAMNRRDIIAKLAASSCLRLPTSTHQFRARLLSPNRIEVGLITCVAYLAIGHVLKGMIPMPNMPAATFQSKDSKHKPQNKSTRNGSTNKGTVLCSLWA